MIEISVQGGGDTKGKLITLDLKEKNSIELGTVFMVAWLHGCMVANVFMVFHGPLYVIFAWFLEKAKSLHVGSLKDKS